MQAVCRRETRRRVKCALQKMHACMMNHVEHFLKAINWDGAALQKFKNCTSSKSRTYAVVTVPLEYMYVRHTIHIAYAKYNNNELPIHKINMQHFKCRYRYNYDNVCFVNTSLHKVAGQADLASRSMTITYEI